jgi:hypothetical protein
VSVESLAEQLTCDLTGTVEPVQEHLLIRSDKGQTGFKGVHPSHGRYEAKCSTPPCRHNYLGSFGTPEEGAQAYLQHYQKEHPEELMKERVPRPVPLPELEHRLIGSDRSSTGFKGVQPNKGRYQVQCDTSPCHRNHLGTFDTSEEAAQAYLQHRQLYHSPVLIPVQQHLLIRSDRKDNKTGYKGVHPNMGRYQATCNTPPCRLNHLGIFGTPEDARCGRGGGGVSGW